jgi:hypothetical protein
MTGLFGRSERTGMRRSGIEAAAAAGAAMRRWWETATVVAVLSALVCAGVWNLRAPAAWREQMRRDTSAVLLWKVRATQNPSVLLHPPAPLRQVRARVVRVLTRP